MRTTFVVLAVLASASSFAQSGKVSSKPGQSFFSEFRGAGMLFSANYDRRFTKSAFGLGGRIGVGFFEGTRYTPKSILGPGEFFYSRQVSVMSVPVQLNYLFGKPSSKGAFEVGAGATFTTSKADYLGNSSDPINTSVYGNLSFMYRRMPTNGGFSWRAGFSPVFAKGKFYSTIGGSIGYNF